MFEFIQIKNNNIDIEKLKIVIRQFERMLGKLPPHLEMLGNIDPNILSDFIKYNMSLLRNRKFHKDYFAFIRLYVARKQDYKYCIPFNTGLLLGNGYDKNLIESLDKIEDFPFQEDLKMLVKKAYKAIFDSSEFGENDLRELENIGWDITSIYQVIEHIGLLEKNSRIIQAFLKN